MARLELSPIHNDLQSTLLTSSSAGSYTSLVNQYAGSDTAYTTLQQPVSGTSSYTSGFKTSGYQYLLGSSIHQFNNEVVPSADSWMIKVTQMFHEGINSLDRTNEGRTVQKEPVNINDIWIVGIRRFFAEGVNSLDSFLSVRQLSELVNAKDTWLVKLNSVFSQPVPVHDSWNPFMSFDTEDTCVVQIQEQSQDDGQVLIEVASPFFDSISTNVAVAPAIPTITVSASASGSGGTTLFHAPRFGDVNPTYTVQNFTITYPDALPSISYCNVLDFSVNLDQGGGTFNVYTATKTLVPGQATTVFGLPGTITEVQTVFNSGTVGYRNIGIFGDASLNKSINLLAFGNPTLFSLLTNSQAGQAAPDKFGTFSGAAKAIATLAKANLTWDMPDFPYYELFSQEGSSAYNALESIITTVGGSLRWDGGNNYIACKPDFTVGTYTIENPNLITSCTPRYLYDVSTGTAGVGAYGLNVYTNNPALYYGSTYLPAPLNNGLNDPIQPFTVGSKVFTSQDPNYPVTVPLDSVEGFYQFLINSNTVTSSTGGTFSPTGTFSAGAVTSDPNSWTSIGAPSISNPMFQPTYDSTGAYSLAIIVNENMFPTNFSQINNGNFVMRVGVRRYNPLTAAIGLADQRNTQIMNQIAKTVGQIRYVKNYVMNVSVAFTGTLPLPGALLEDFQLCGTTVPGGVIESVSLAAPGIMSLSVAQYEHIDFTYNLSNYVFTSTNTVTGP